MDIIRYGKGIRSFTEFIKEWIEEELTEDESKTAKDKIKFHTFSNSRIVDFSYHNKEQGTPDYLIFDSWGNATCKEDDLYNIINRLGECPERYRLLPNFDPSKWDTINPLEFKPSDDAIETLKFLTEIHKRKK